MPSAPVRRRRASIPHYRAARGATVRAFSNRGPFELAPRDWASCLLGSTGWQVHILLRPGKLMARLSVEYELPGWFLRLFMSDQFYAPSKAGGLGPYPVG